MFYHIKVSHVGVMDMLHALTCETKILFYIGKRRISLILCHTYFLSICYVVYVFYQELSSPNNICTTKSNHVLKKKFWSKLKIPYKNSVKHKFLAKSSNIKTVLLNSFIHICESAIHGIHFISCSNIWIRDTCI